MMRRYGMIVLAAGWLTGCGPAGVSAPPDVMTAGSQVYGQNCAGCHTTDGHGMPNIQPALDGSAVVAGDPALLIRVVLAGPAKALPADRPHYANIMPAFDRLSDDDIAAVVTYIRQDFGGHASPVTTADVKVVRDKISAE